MGNANDLIEINVQKLIKADEYLQSGGAVANKYLDALWDFYLPDEQPSNDDASNGGVTELSDEQDSEEEGEEDGEEEEEGILDGGSSQIEG